MHIISGMSQGGAEGVLFRLITKLPQFEHIVVSLSGEGYYTNKYNNIDVASISFDLKNGSMFDRLKSSISLIRYINRSRVTLVQTWMYHADFFGGLIAKISNNVPVVWNVRHSIGRLHKEKKSIRLILKINSFLSSFIPSSIVYCARSIEQQHVNVGYNSSKSSVIQNGYDLERYTINSEFSTKFRKHIKLPHDTFLFGHVGRFHPQKDHSTLFKAFFLVQKQGYNVCLACFGDGVNNKNLQNIFGGFTPSNIFLMGSQDNMVIPYNAMDCLVSSSSWGEGFPNVVAEAMACGAPCIVTDVGDSSLIVGNNGRVVPASNPYVMANEMCNFVLEKKNSFHVWSKRVSESRRMIQMHFELSNMADSYAKLWLRAPRKTSRQSMN